MLAITIQTLWAVLAIISRVAPHPANVTAMTSFCLLLAWQFPHPRNFLMIVISALCSDILLSFIYHYSPFGTWSLFTYSAYAILFFTTIIFVNQTQQPSKRHIIAITAAASLFYWLWTNLGVFILSGMYPHTLSGIASCYLAALPFLRNSLLGDLCWMLSFLSLQYTVNNLCLKKISFGFANKY